MERRRLVFEDAFTGPQLDLGRWVPHYLPQWTTPERSAARYDLTPDGLRLRIDADQPAWRPEEGELRVSNVQTGVRRAHPGSPEGTSRDRDDQRVVTGQTERRSYLPTSGRVEAELMASADPTVMLAFWLVGFADAPEESGELCVVELFGRAIGAERCQANVGVKARHDPRLVDEMDALTLDLDATQRHTYAVAWGADGVAFTVDDRVVKTSNQRLDYPMQLMLDLFEFPQGVERPAERYPKVGTVCAVRGYADA